MSAIEKRLIEAAKTALAVIGQLSKLTGSKRAEIVLKTIDAIVESVSDGFDRKLSPDEVMKAIDDARAELEVSLAANDAEAQSEIDKKFPTS